MNKTPIEWTDFTLNPFRFRNLETGKVGHHCDKISPGCKNCYSSTMQAGPYLSGLTFIETNKPKGEFFLDEGALQQVLRRKKPARIFWCDMTDMFLADYPDEWIDRCFAVMALTPQHTHQVLTKRADRMLHVMTKVIRTQKFWPMPNVHLGVSVENQEYADKRIPDLLATPAAVRFVSYEPALGPVDFRNLKGGTLDALSGRDFECLGTDNTPALDWIIIGGESGPDARPFDIAWARNTIEQCKAAGVACFVKQLGAKPYVDGRADQNQWEADVVPHWPGGILFREDNTVQLRDKKGGDMSEWPADLRVRQTPEVAKCQ